jgi:cellobiose-specific phosphotransferase system component IIC
MHDILLSPMLGSYIWIGGGGAGLLLLIIIIILLLR